MRLEPDNPYDPNAIAVENLEGSTIGYLPRNNFLANAIHEKTTDVEVLIMSIKASECGNLGVVLSVSFTPEYPTRVYTGKYQKPTIRSWLASLFSN